MKHLNTDITFYLIRHAECEKNLQPHLIGGQSVDSPLTSLGKIQAIKLANYLDKNQVKFDYVFTSPFLRSKQTMLLASTENYLFKKVEELGELSQGEWEDKPREEIYTDKQLAYINTKGSWFVPPGGESQRMVERRISKWLEDEILYNPKYLDGPKKIAIFSHGNALKCLMHYIMGFDDRLTYRIALDNTSVSIFKFNKQGWWPIKINDTSHL